jgi:hypothetical protein
MTATDLAAVVVTVVCLAVVAVLVLAVLSLIRTVRELRLTVDQLRRSTLPMVDDLATTVSKAGEELERVDGLIDRAERISHTLDVASRLTYRAVAPPLIKTMSLVAGASRATWRLRGRTSHRAIDVRGRQKGRGRGRTPGDRIRGSSSSAISSTSSSGSRTKR